MPKVTFVDFEGSTREVLADPGISLMKAAVRNNVPGIDAECGGQMACATCHVVVDAEWFAVTGPPSEAETVMLEFAEGVSDRSRLSCQIAIVDDLDGLVVSTPETQG